MRWALAAVLGVVLLVGMQLDASAAGHKRGKRAKVHRAVARTSAERLVDLSLPVAPGPQPPGPGTPALPSFVSVGAKEFSLTLSRPLVAAGDVRVELRNNGEDPHNLVVSPEDTHTPLASFSDLDPGLYERRTVALAPGRYKLWCSLEFHEGLGMSVTLRVQ
jgi:plastocyanin